MAIYAILEIPWSSGMYAVVTEIFPGDSKGREMTIFPEIDSRGNDSGWHRSPIACVTL